MRGGQTGVAAGILAVAVIALCLAAGPALGGQATSPSGQVQQTQVAHSPSTAGAGTTVTITTSLTKASGAR